ncbi:MAG: heme-binding protein, partial [Verrucomicrobiaceae bacterium]
MGHNNETVADARYLDLVVRGLLWSTGKLNTDYQKAYAGPAGKFEKTEVRPPEQGRRGRWPKPPEGATLVRATASSVQDANRPWLAIDGSEESRWCAESQDFPQWYQIEFEKEVPLTGIDIIWESKNNAYRHKIEGSKDGEKWEVLADLTQQEKGGDTSAAFSETAVKFVKITCTGTSQGGWASIRQISAKGEGIGPLFPKPREGGRQRTADPYQKSGNSVPKISNLTAEQVAEVLKDVKVADGFDVSLFATPAEANYPVYVASAPGGDLYVASDGNGSLGTDPQRGRIVRLRDKDNDGRADEVTEFVKDLDSPRGMVW